jgi:hypothetical protein
VWVSDILVDCATSIVKIEGLSHLHFSSLTMETLCSFERSVKVCQTSGRYNPLPWHVPSP